MSGTGRKTETSNKAASNSKVSNQAKATGESGDLMAEVLAEMKQMRRDISERLDKFEETIKDVREELRASGQRMDEAEQRVSDLEDRSIRTDKLLAYILRKQHRLEAHCEDIENRARRSNLRIYGVKEGTEGSENMRDFTEKLLKTALGINADEDLGIERAHRSLVSKSASNAPRSIIVKFLHFQTKQRILFNCWNKKDVEYEGSQIRMDNDYSATVQRRRMEYAEIKRQLKDRGIKFKSRYPATLRVFLEEGEKTFDSAWEAADQLKHLGIDVTLSEAELMDRDLQQLGLPTRHNQDKAPIPRALVRDIQSLYG